MKKSKINMYGSLLLATVIMTLGACKKDYVDPSRATEDQVFGSAKGLTGAAIGLQRDYSAGRAGSIYTRVTIDGFTTNQLIILNQGNTSEYQLSLGGNFVDGTNSILTNLWTISNKIIYDADNVITNASNAGDPTYASGLICFATLFKAQAMGDLAMYWEEVPQGTGEDVNFVSRADGFNQAISAIDEALAANNANAISPSFLSNIPAGIDIINSLQALKARFSLFVGNNAQALTAANAVDLTKTSVMNFDALTLNPIFETATSTNNVYQPVDSTMGLPAGIQPDLADQRVPFYITINESIAPRYRIGGFGIATSSPWPIFLPGEITLIKAEAYARQNDLDNGLAELNKVLTKTPSEDPLGVGAGLTEISGPLSQEELLDQIYRNRCIELFMSGLKLEDMRRFNRPDSEKKRNLFPYPFRERDNNPNTPADPAF